jgi:hypothetical protein
MAESKASALDALIDGTRNDITRILQAVINNRDSASASIKGKRTFALTATGTILAPILLGLAALFPTAALAAVLALLFFVGLTGVLIVGWSGRIGKIEKELSAIKDTFGRLLLVMSTVATAYRSEVAVMGLEDSTLTDDFYAVWLISNASIYYEVSRVASKYLDEPTKQAVKAAVVYLCDQHITQWDVLKGPRGEKLLKDNDFLRKTIDDYSSYCKKLSTASASPLAAVQQVG